MMMVEYLDICEMRGAVVEVCTRLRRGKFVTHYGVSPNSISFVHWIDYTQFPNLVDRTVSKRA